MTTGGTFQRASRPTGSTERAANACSVKQESGGTGADQRRGALFHLLKGVAGGRTIEVIGAPNRAIGRAIVRRHDSLDLWRAMRCVSRRPTGAPYQAKGLRARTGPRLRAAEPFPERYDCCWLGSSECWMPVLTFGAGDSAFDTTPESLTGASDGYRLRHRQSP